MKKLISLLLAVMLVMSMMTFSVSASTDTLVVVTTAEDNISDGNLATSGNQGYSTNATGNVTVAPIETGSNNKIFSMIKTNGAKYDSAGVLALRVTGAAKQNKSFFSSSMNRFTADVMLPSTVGTTMLFVPRTAWSTAATTETGFGVCLKDGGAYYYDVATEDFIPFIDNGTMKAEEWYHVEAVMDNRETKLTGNKTYMNAFVYDSTGKLVGTSNWQYVSNVKSYSGNYSFLSVQIQTYGYDAGNIVKIDNFNAYTISSLPEYTVSGEVEASVVANKYVEISPEDFKVVGEVFNRSNSAAVLTDKTAEKAVRFEMDVRFPELTNESNFDFLRLYSTAAGKQAPSISSDNGTTQVIEGTVQIDGTALKVKAYNATTGVYDTDVALNVGDSYTVEAGEWYKLVWDIDYTNFEAPTAMLYVKDAEGNIVAQTANEYVAQPIPKNNYDQWVSVIVYGTTALKVQKFHMDNTNIYLATTEAGLNDVETRTVYVEDDFENYEVGTVYMTEVVPTHAGGAAGSYYSTTSKIVAPSFTWEEGMQLESTDPLALTFTYTNPVPVANITTNNIEFYEDGVKLYSGYTLTHGTVDANNCTTTFTVAANALSWGKDYTIRLKAEVADYNTAISGGVHADSGLYKDITFSVASLIPDCDIVGEILEGTGVVSGKVTFNSNEESPLNCYVVLAVYEGQKLAGLKKSSKVEVPANAVDYEVTVDEVELPAGATAKLFVWNNFETMRPWIAPVALGE